ncbi:MAG: EAL domain-containing protein [Gammaproteobacteria bacterium]
MLIPRRPAMFLAAVSTAVSAPAAASPAALSATASSDIATAGGLLAFLAVGLLLYTWRLRASLRRTQAELASAAAQWTQAMDVLPDPMYLVDLDDRLVRANRAFYQQVGRSPEDCIGRDVRSLIHLKPENTPCPVCAARLERRDAFFTKEPDDPSNPTGKPLEITIRVIRDAGGEPIGVVQALRDMSHLRNAEEALRVSEARMAEAQRIAHFGNWTWELASDRVEWSDEVYRIFGVDRDAFEVTYERFLDLVYAPDRERVQESVRQALAGANGGMYRIEHRFTLLEGEVRVALEEGHVYRDADGQPVRMIGVVQDITARKRAEEALRQEKDRAEVTLKSIGDAVITTDVNGVIDDANPAALQLLDTTPGAVIGHHYGRVLHLVNEEQERPLDDPIGRCLSGHDRLVNDEDTLLVRDKDEVAVQLTAAAMVDRSGTLLGAVVVLRDITEVRGMARQLSHQATHDALTGLINRAEFEVRLQHALEGARVDGKDHALIYLDLDQFKVVNDTCGHLAGDELLKQVASLLHSGVRNVDTLARLGGDEFGVLLEACPLDRAKSIAHELRQQLKDLRFAWEDKVFEVGASFGLVPVSADSGSRFDLLRAADSACYVAKDQGRNRVHASLPGDDEMARHHGEMHWVHRITQALDDDRFVLYCQPIVPLGERDDRLRRFEILVRMLDEQGEIVMPGAFIPAAERYQLMPAIDRMVVRHTFAALQLVRSETELDCFSCSLNLSGQSLCDEDMLDDIIAAMKTSGIAPECVSFEITETAAIANLTKAKAFIRALKDMGARFALDDFGSGLSSFGYLKNLAIDCVKIDGSFVKNIAHDPLDRAMVSSINELGHLMGIDTIAEFVDNQGVLDVLTEIGVDYAQGYHLGRPLPLSEVVRVPQFVSCRS